MTLLADVYCPGSQEDLFSNWQPAHSLLEDAVSGAEDCSGSLAFLLWAVAHLPLPPGMEGLNGSQLSLLLLEVQSFIL